MVSSTSLTALLVLTLSSISSTSAQDQSTPTSTSAGSAPESSSTSSPSVGSNTTTNTYTPVISNHTNPLWNPNSNSTDPYAVGNNNSYSPPFPYTLTRGSGPTWDTAIQKAKDFIQFHNLTIEEKVNLTTGLGWEGKGYSGRACVGNIPPIERIGWKGLCLEDSPAGVRFTDGVSVFPAGINVASTFDRGLMYSRGYAMGKEFVGKGVNVALGPGMNGERTPNAGRNWEMAGGDPYLAGEVAFETVKGMQDAGIQATAKHYILNEQERNRTTSSSNVDDYTTHMHYLPPFLKAVQAGVASVMCSYNLINSSYACQNAQAQNGWLKHELGFQGYIMSDWAATHSGVDSALNGLDMTMPGDVTFGSNDSYFGANLTQAVNNGSVPLERLDDMATRILGGWFLVGQDSPTYPNVSFDAFDRNDDSLNDYIDVREDHGSLIREIGAASTVLLKNVNGTLPLYKPRTLAVFGSDAGPAQRGPNGLPDRGGFDGVVTIGWGSGTADFTYLISPLEALQKQALKDRTQFSWFLEDYNLDGASALADNKDVAIVFIASDAGEEYITVDGNVGDRNNITAWKGGDDLVLAVANTTDNVVVVIHSPGAIDMEAWIEHPNVTAVVMAGFPGQEAGNSIVDILYGAYNPSGRLPYTIPKSLEEWPAQIQFVNTNLDAQPQVDYTEGIYLDYRYYQQFNATPRYGFGYGLSYTSFNYTNFQVKQLTDNWEQRRWDVQEAFTASNATNQVGSSLSKALHEPRIEVTVDIQNVGGVYGCEVPQLYLGFPEGVDQPPKVLKGFTRVTLDKFEAKQAQFQLSHYDLAVWDVVASRWTVPSGDFTVYVGRSAFDDESIQGVIPASWLPGPEDDIYAY